MSEDDASTGAHEAWRKDGRCSACRFFVSDFGEAPTLYGHCKMYPRPGARESTDYACPEYVALPGFAALTESTSPDRVIAERASERVSKRSVVPSGAARRSRRRTAGPKIVLLRRSQDGEITRIPTQSGEETGRFPGQLGRIQFGKVGQRGFQRVRTRELVENLNSAAHHQSAINMSKAELEHGDNAWAKEMAQKIIDAQESEIAEMLGWLSGEGASE